MTETVTGGCLCKAVTYEYTGEIGPAAYCNCTDCRNTTGSAFNISVKLEMCHFTLTGSDELGRFTKQSDSGNQLTRVFCRTCGSPLFTESPKHSEFVWVKAGSLDNADIVKPAYQSWVKSKVGWSTISAAIPAYETTRTDND